MRNESYGIIIRLIGLLNIIRILLNLQLFDEVRRIDPLLKLFGAVLYMFHLLTDIKFSYCCFLSVPASGVFVQNIKQFFRCGIVISYLAFCNLQRFASSCTGTYISCCSIFCYLSNFA